MTTTLHPPLTNADIEHLSAGDRVLISGTVYTARDAAHKRLVEAIEAESELPFPLENQVIYYTGPTPAAAGRATGSAGPTTSARMDAYTPLLLSRGLKVMIGKGDRSREVAEAIVQNGAVYLAAVGGAGALLARTIVEAEPVAYQELGAEAVFKLEVEEFPAIVAIDSKGNDIYQSGPESYRQER